MENVIESIDISTIVSDGFTSIFYTTLFLVPGYIIKKIVSCFIPTKQSLDINGVLQYLTYSLINYLITNLIFSTPLVFDNFVKLVLENLICSVVIGFALVFLDSVFHCVLKRIKKDHINRYSSAWDYFLIEYSEGKKMQIQVILKDGKTVCGIFSTKSYAPVKDDCDDLFIETYTNSKFKKIENTGGIYISSDQIKEIIVVRKE